MTSAEEVDALGHDALVLTEERQPAAPAGSGPCSAVARQGRPVVEADPCEVSEGNRRTIPTRLRPERSCQIGRPDDVKDQAVVLVRGDAGPSPDQLGVQERGQGGSGDDDAARLCVVEALGRVSSSSRPPGSCRPDNGQRTACRSSSGMVPSMASAATPRRHNAAAVSWASCTPAAKTMVWPAFAVLAPGLGDDVGSAGLAEGSREVSLDVVAVRPADVFGSEVDPDPKASKVAEPAERDHVDEVPFVDGIPEHLRHALAVRGRRPARHEGARFRDGVEDGDIAVGGRMVGFVDHDCSERSGGYEGLDEAVISEFARARVCTLATTISASTSSWPACTTSDGLAGMPASMSLDSAWRATRLCVR